MAKLYLSAVGAEFGTYRQQLRHRLLLNGHSVKTGDDFTTDSGPSAERLRAWLGECDAVIWFAGDRFGPAAPPAGNAGQARRSLVQDEVLLARSLGKRILAVEPSPSGIPRDSANDEPEDLRQCQQTFLAAELTGSGVSRIPFSCPQDLAGKVETTLRSLPGPREVATMTDSPPVPPKPACPYPGLRPFEEADAPFFFGRRRLVEELLTQLEFQPMVLLLGSSGCGKSSIVRAGVIPRWREKYPGGKVILARPGTHPFENLAQCLDGFPDEAAAAVRSPSAKVFRHLRPAPGPGETARQILLAIDPFEELFTLVPERDELLRRAFLDSLVDLARLPDAGIQVLLTLRDEFIPHLRSHDDFYRIADNSLQRITSLKGEGLRECMEAPAQAQGAGFEEGLAEFLQRQVESRDGQLPLLADALATWWREEDLPDRLLRRSTLNRIGGWEGALPQRLDHWFGTLSSPDQSAARSLLLDLVDWCPLAGDTLPMLRPAYRSSLVAKSSEALVAELETRAGLLVSRKPAPQDPLLELSHESIIHAWPRFRTWMEEIRAAVTLHHRLREDAGSWNSASGRSKRDKLWRGYHLDQALEREQHGDFARTGGLSPIETAFLQASTRARTLRSVRDQVLGLAAGIVAVVSLGSALLATAKFRDANSQKRAAEIKAGLGWLAQAETAEGSTDSGFFAGFATGFDGAGRPVWPAGSQEKPSTGWIFPALQRDPYPRYLTLQDSPARKIEADRRMFSSPKPFLWSSPFHPDDAPVAAAKFSLDGLRLASTGPGGRVHLWSVATGERERVLNGSTSPALDLDFSPAGTILASGHADGTLILWDLNTGQKTASLQGHAGPVRAVAFHPRGTEVASGGDDGAIKIWQVEAAGNTRTFSGHSGPVVCLAFGPGGLLLASGGHDRFVRVWDVARGEEMAILSGHVNAVQALAFSPLGGEVASASPDQRVLLWDLNTQKASSSLALPDTSAHGLAFSPDGSHLAVAGDDGRLRIWTLGQDQSTRVFCGHAGPVRCLDFSPDGKLVVTGSDDRTVKLWAVRDAWKNPAQTPAPSLVTPATGRSSASGAIPPGGFDWFRYLRDGWVRFDEHRSAWVWKSLPGGLPYADPNIPVNSWVGILRSTQGQDQTLRLLSLALEAQDWESAAFLRKNLPGDLSLSSSPASVSLLLRRVREDQSAGRPAQAEWRMRLGDVLFDSDPEWAAMRARSLEAKGDKEGALTMYRRLNRLEGWEAVARLTPDGKEAVNAWRRILAEKKTAPLPLFLAAGQRAAQAGDLSAMREFFSTAMQRFPGERALKTAFARHLIDLGALEEGLAQFEALTTGEGNPDERLTALLQEAGCLDAVLSLLHEKSAALKASGPEAAALEHLEKLSRLYLAAHRTNESILVLKDRISYLQKVHRHANVSGPLHDLSQALMRAGRREEAFLVMRARIDLLKAGPPGEDLASALVELQTAFAQAGLHAEAIAVLQERIALRRGQSGQPASDLLSELAGALQKAGQTGEALAVLEELTGTFQTEGKDPAPAYRAWATALHEAGKPLEAWAAYRKLSTLPTLTGPELSEIAYWGALHGYQEEALALFDQAAARTPHDRDRALVGCRRGWALLGTGAFEDAFRAFGMAKAQLESSPETAKLIESDLLSGLAAAFWLTGRKGASLDEYEGLWRQQKADEHWENPAFVRNLDLPEAGRNALLELQAIWQERMHAARSARQ